MLIFDDGPIDDAPLEVDWPASLRAMGERYEKGEVSVMCAAAAIAFEQLQKEKDEAVATSKIANEAVLSAIQRWADDLAPGGEEFLPLRQEMERFVALARGEAVA